MEDEQPFVVTEKQVSLKWGGGFDCKLCGVKFTPGMTVQWIYCNSTPEQGTGNFFACMKCCEGKSKADIMAMAKASLTEATKLAKLWRIYGPDWIKDFR